MIQPCAVYLADRFSPTGVVVGGLVHSALAIMLVPLTGGLLLVCAAILGGIGVGTVWTNIAAMSAISRKNAA